MSPRRTPRLLSALAPALSAAALVGCSSGTAPGSTPRDESPAARGEETGVVESVTDGDTIRLADDRRVRLVQIDAPESNERSECGGEQASAALREELPEGSRVRLEADPATDSVDQHGRLLRYVYLGKRNLNVWLVERGHAMPYFYDGERGRHADELLRGAAAARAAGRGLWGGCPRAVLDPSRGAATG